MRRLSAAGLCVTAAMLVAVLVPGHGESAEIATVVFTPAADARVDAGLPDTNFGTTKALLVDETPVERQAYVRFDVTGLSGTVESARLRLFAYDGSADGPAVAAAATDWDERTVTWSARPPTLGAALADTGAVATGTWLELDVTAAVTGNGAYAFALLPTSGDGVDMYSKDSPQPPQLVVTVRLPDTTPPTVSITSPVAGTTFNRAEPVAVTAAAADDEGVVRVEFYDNGTLESTDTEPPWEHAWVFERAANGPHRWTARAYDAAGNTSTSTAVDLDVAIDPPAQPIVATVETPPVPHAGDAADDVALWIDRGAPARSTIIGTDKQGSLLVYDLEGKELHRYDGGRPNNVDVRDGVVLGGTTVSLAAVSNRANGSIRVYAVDPVTRGLTNVAARTLSTGISVYGLCMYRSGKDDRLYAFVTDKAGVVKQFELIDDGTGRVDAREVRTFAVGSITEGCAADDELGRVYFAEETIGVWRYGAEPGDGAARTKVDGTGGSGNLRADVEGIAIFDEGEGRGYLLVTSQGDDTFAVYERGGDNAYVMSFGVGSGAFDEVTESDGIDATPVSLGSAFPDGVFVAHDDRNDDLNQNFKLVPWERIARWLRPELGGCTRPYSATSPWNTPVGPSPVYDERSAEHVAAIDGVLTSDMTQYTYPVYEVSAATPMQTVALSGWYSNVVDGGATLLNQRAGTAPLPIPADALPAAGSDAQIILLDPVTGHEWGASRLTPDGSGGWTAWNAYHYNTHWSAVPPNDASGRPFFLRGAGVPYLAGLVRPCEIARGRIEHALAFAYDFPTAEFVYPATKSDGDSVDPADLPEGARLQLDPSLTTAQIRAWGCDGPCLTIARALQTYGMYVIDNAGRPKVMLEYEGTAHWSGVVDAQTVTPIPLSAFSVVDLPGP